MAKQKEVDAKIEASSKNSAKEKNEESEEVEELPGKPESKGEEKIARKSKNVQSAQERIEALEADRKAAKEDLEKALKQDREDLKRKIDNARKVLKEASDKKIEHESVTSVRATNLKQGLEDAYKHRVATLRSQHSLEREILVKNSKEREEEVVRQETTKYESELEAAMTAMHAEIEQRRKEVQKDYEEAQAVHAKLQKLANDNREEASKSKPRASEGNIPDKGRAKSPSRAEREPDIHFKIKPKDINLKQNLERPKVGGPGFQGSSSQAVRQGGPGFHGSSSQAVRQGTPSKAESEDDDRSNHSPADSPVHSGRSVSSGSSPTYSPLNRSQSPKIAVPKTTTIASGFPNTTTIASGVKAVREPNSNVREPNRGGNSNVKNFTNPVKEGQGDCACTSERCRWEFHVHPQDFTDASIMLMRAGGSRPGSRQLCTAMALGVHCPFGDACKYIHDPKRVPKYERKYGHIRGIRVPKYPSAAQNQTNRNNEVARVPRVLQPDRREGPGARWPASHTEERSGSYGRKNSRGNVDDPYEEHKKRKT